MSSMHKTALLGGRTIAAGLLLATALAGSQAAAAPAKKASIEGVWKVTNVVITGADPLTITSPQPSLYIFAHGHYANVSDQSRTPRTAVTFKDPAKPTDAEKLAKYEEWGPVAAQAGTYEVKGSTLIRHPMVAKNVGALAPSTTPDPEIKISGDTMVMIGKSAPGRPAREQKVTFTRVK